MCIKDRVGKDVRKPMKNSWKTMTWLIKSLKNINSDEL